MIFAARHLGSRVARVSFLLACGAFFGLPIIWLMLAATRPTEGFSELHPLSFGSFENVGQAWENLQTYNGGVIVDWIWNSFYYSGSAVLLALTMSVPAGYALAKFDFAGRKTLLVLTLIGMIIPMAALVLPLYLEMNALGWLGTAASVIFPMAFYPFAVYLCYVYYASSLPNNLLEAGRVDGASEWRLFFSVVLPLSKPVIGLVFFFSFVHTWTNFFLPYVMLSDNGSFNLQVGLMALLQSTGVLNPNPASDLPIWEPEGALAALIAVAPVLIAFLVAQPFLGKSDVAGAVKG